MTAEVSLHLRAVTLGMPGKELPENIVGRHARMRVEIRVVRNLSGHIHRAPCQGFILGFGSVATGEIPKAVRRMAAVLRPEMDAKD